MDNNINYKLSLHILNTLKKLNLITEKEYIAIDKENKKSFEIRLD
ncbi:hypothetical protein Dtox_1889 [Desulfofarcimen acetoxidans DSM 771]|uniref:SHOCT-like domain-containing protein n=1 Tax=Desulfofarcimen acetoxidans (strain ATCC 49208 / DSM 771 / KCTC 5769 / VKM B-1644 / 5575) TaxID=485916 RepID=C8VXS8_DESAS|nr:SHOCT domain-containing protein [Desulfofarcimen acetoxidans]ACV62734.1 hypothetical protein Dtox_1889 [Desulfofarcimen acetoxidans DSM 771]